MSLGEPPERLRPLPIGVRPKPAEPLESYVGRLARANHLRPSYLHAYLCGPPDWLGVVDLKRLAVLTGRPAEVLQRTLTDLAPAPPPARQPRPPRPSAPTPARTLKTRNKTELFAAIRHDAETLSLSIRALAKRYHVHRRTIRQALASPVPPLRKQQPPRRSQLDPYKDAVDAILEQDRLLPPRRRSTIRRIWEQLLDEHGAQVSYSTVRLYVARRRSEMVQIQ